MKLDEALEAAQDRWADRVMAGELKPMTMAHYVAHGMRFVKFANAHGVETVDQIDGDLCAAFMFAGVTGTHHADPRRGNDPVAQTQRSRLLAIRSLTRAAKENGIAFPEGDPTEGLKAATAKVASRATPLTPDEVRQLRARGTWRTNDTLRPVQIELALAGATQAEIVMCRVGDVDVENGTITLAESRQAPREILLDPYAVEVLTRRLEALRRKYRGQLDPEGPLANNADPRFANAAGLNARVAKSMREAMDNAGLTRRGLSPMSLVEFAANRCYAQTGRIEMVTSFLGRKSLDSTMRLIDRAWQNRYAHLFVEDDSLPRRVS